MGKDILTQTKSTIPPSPQKSNGQPHREWGSSGFDTSDVIHQQNGWRQSASLSCGGFRVGNHMISSHVI